MIRKSDRHVRSGARAVNNEERDSAYALNIANGSHLWYETAAKRSRRLHRVAELAIISTSALIPLSIAAYPQLVLVPAVLGSVVTLASGARATFHWHENYLRFSRAREAVEGERRKYRTRAAPYDNEELRDQLLVTEISRIEQDEMGQWLHLSKPPNVGDEK